MKTGNSPQLRTLPPSNSQALNRLERLEEWSEKPAQEVAASIEEPNAGIVEGRAKKKAQKPVNSPELPWLMDESSKIHGSKSVNFKLPMDLFLKLKWLGDTTYGSSMTQIVISVLEPEIARMLAERKIIQ